MRAIRQVVRFSLIAALAAVVVLALLQVTGKLAPTYRWLVQYFAPEVWSALAAWVAVAVGIVTVVVAGRYAKQQVEKAQDQVREAQTARLAQERQAQEALQTQVRLANEALVAQAKLNQKTLEHDAAQAQRIRREQAQPNVVLYSELNPTVKQFLEIVLKNFGTTPAYDVRVTIDPPLKATPNLISGDKLADVLIPEFPILAPGQEWRTGWDHSVTRKRYQDKWLRRARTSEAELTDSEKLEKEYWLTRQSDKTSPDDRLQEQFLPSRYTATVTYRDSYGKKYETKAILDSEMYKGTTWVAIRTTHDLTKMLEKELSTQNDRLEAIHRRLAEFGTEHEGVWIYGTDDNDEREYRKKVAEAEAQEQREFEEGIGLRVRRTADNSEPEAAPKHVEGEN